MALLSSLFRFLRRLSKPSPSKESSKTEKPKIFFVDHLSSLSSSSSQDILVKDSDAPARPIPSASVSSSKCLEPHAIYNGGYQRAKIRGVRLRIANGGAGQSGLIQAWADAFIQYMVAMGMPPFEVAWYLGDTTESLALLVSGCVDIAVTYNPAAEKQLLDRGDAVDCIYGFRDHFLLVGPHSNPASLEDSDDILTMFSKIVSSGNADSTVPPDPDLRPPTRFLSRFDKSATNIKESQIFLTIGQVPWALTYSKWYHQYPQFPFEALKAAAALSEYTLIDLGTWLSSPTFVRTTLKPFKIGSDNPDDLLLNPAHVLLGKSASTADELPKWFMEWISSDEGGQKVVQQFSRNGHILYTRAPRS